MLSVQLSILKFPYLSFSDVKVEVTALPSYEEKEEQFKDQVVSFSYILSASTRLLSFCESDDYLS